MKKLPQRTPSSVTGNLNNKDGKLGTQHLTEATRYTKVSISDLRRMITLCVENTRHLERFARAVCDAQLAAFAAIYDQMDSSFGDVNAVVVQGCSPQSHRHRLLGIASVRFAKCL
jgi:hypothetical protein